MDKEKKAAMPENENEEQKSSKKAPLLTRRDGLKIIGTTAATAVLTQLVISGPFSSDAVQGIGQAI